MALNDLSLEIKSGEIYGLLGANGAGKSTTINLLLGFIKPDTGAVEINQSNPLQARKSVGYVPENVNLYTHLSGIENLDYFCKLAGLRYTEIELTDFLANCGLAQEAHKSQVKTYSKGMRQKVGIAIAYAKKASTYLLDEPASGLDPAANNELSALLKKLSAEGITILMASHDLFRVRETCNKIGILKDGSLVKELLAADVSSNELEKIYLDYMHN